MDRAQCLVVRGNKILTVKHRQHGIEYFCLPGGGAEEGETPEFAAARELKEECLVDVEWRTLDNLCERDRAYMWSAGLIYYDMFSKELNSCGDDIRYPQKRVV